MERYHFHNVFEIYFTNVGGVKYFVDGGVYQVEKNDLFVFNNADLHRIVVPSGLIYDRYIAVFSPDYIRGMNTDNTNLLECFVDRKADFCHRISLTTEQAGEFLSLLRAAGRYESSESYGFDICRKIMLAEILIFVNRLYRSAALAPSFHAGSEYAQIKPVLDHINKNLTSALTLEEIANRFFISKYHLCKLFKKATGFTVNEYIISRRILRACDLLRKNLPVSAVCELAGFRNDCYFITTFKKMVGVTPKQYAIKENRIEGE